MEAVWSLNDELISSRRTLSSDGREVSWVFKSYVSRFIPFKVFECSLSCNGELSFGFGVGNSDQDAAAKALAEAWERRCCYDLAKVDKTVSSTNGFAAGVTNTQAVELSRNELIERAVMIKAWQSCEGWELIKFDSFFNRLLKIAYRLTGWRIDLFNVHSNIGKIKACLATHRGLGAVFDTSFAADKNKAEEKVFYGIMKNILLAASAAQVEFPHVGAPDHHRIFYSNPTNLEAFKFLYDHASFSCLNVDFLDKISSHLIYEPGSLPAVAYSRNTCWEDLKWGKQSIGGRNKWPHPLA